MRTSTRERERSRPVAAQARAGQTGGSPRAPQTREWWHYAVAVAVALAVVEFLVGVIGWESTLGVAAAAWGSYTAALAVLSVMTPSMSVPTMSAPTRTVPTLRARDAVVVDLVEPDTQNGQVGEPADLSVVALSDDPSDDPEHDKPRRLQVVDVDRVIETGLAVTSGLAVAMIVRILNDHQSLLGSTVWWFGAFIALTYVIAWAREGIEVGLDRVVTALVWSAGAIIVGVLAYMLVFLVGKGLPKLTFSFFTEDLSTVGPLDSGGGALHAIIGTLEQVGIATVVVVPIAILTAVYLNEIGGVLARPVRFITDAMSGLPSIVAGLFVFSIWVDGRGFTGFAGSIALIVLMLPTVTRTSEEILRTIPDTLREASMALGATQLRVVMSVVVPTALSGLVTAVILGVARAIGETAPMLLTAFGSDSVNLNPFSGAQSDLPLFVYKLIRVPNAAQNDRAWAGMLVLVIMVLVLFTTARYASTRSAKKLGRAR